MRKLLSAGFARLRKSKTLGVILLTLFLIQCLSIYVNYREMELYPDYTATLDGICFNYAIYIGVAIAIFCSLFLGTEYSDGTIRNKLMIGHTRVSIYFSSLILCCTASVLICFAGILPSIVPGIPILGLPHMGLAKAALLVLCSILAAAAYASLFTLAAMLIHGKAVSSVITILAAITLLMIASGVQNGLMQPEIWDDYIYQDENGEVITEPAHPNPYYVRGAKREFYEFLLDVLPSGQASRILMNEISLSRTVFYDTVILLLTGGVGIFFFLRKDIK